MNSKELERMAQLAFLIEQCNGDIRAVEFENEEISSVMSKLSGMMSGSKNDKTVVRFEIEFEEEDFDYENLFPEPTKEPGDELDDEHWTEDVDGSEESIPDSVKEGGS